MNNEKQAQVIEGAINSLKLGMDPRQVLDYVYTQARLQGLLEMARLADRLKQKQTEARAERRVA